MRKISKFIKKFFSFLLKSALAFIVVSILTVLIYKVVDPPLTPVMIIKSIEGLFEGKLVGVNKQWVDFDEISPRFFRAVVAAEDARFMKHYGIDWKAVETARRYNEIYKGRRRHGASTITMQTAKNTFLTHHRIYIRKAFEVYFTYLIEFIWGKKRILEVYANVIEFGEGIYGVEEASQVFFNKSAKKLSKRQAALLASVLPNPSKRNPSRPTRYLNKRVRKIQNRMNSVRIPK